MSSQNVDISEPGEPELTEVSLGIYAYIQPDGTWWINNTGFLSGRTEALAFGPPAKMPFWDGPDWGDLYLDPPFVTFTDELTLHAGEIRAEVRYVGMPAHTTNDRIIWIPDRSVLFAPLGAEIIVPGHGPVFSEHGPIEATLDSLRFVVEVAARGHRDGLPPLEAARRADLGRFQRRRPADLPGLAAGRLGQVRPLSSGPEQMPGRGPACPQGPRRPASPGS